jgi:hypothetical protein
MVSESQGFWSPSLAAERTRSETRVTELRRLTRNRFPLPQICDRRRNRHGEGARFGHDLAKRCAIKRRRETRPDARWLRGCQHLSDRSRAGQGPMDPLAPMARTQGGKHD